MKTITALLLFMTLSGCAAIWGGAHKVTKKDEIGITIRYDTALTSSIMMQRIATAHCDTYNKKIEVVDSKMPGIMLGIIEEQYACIDK